jgi:hypothetical protein
MITKAHELCGWKWHSIPGLASRIVLQFRVYCCWLCGLLVCLTEDITVSIKVPV